MRDKKAEPYREGGDQREASEHDGEEDGDRAATAEQRAEPLREPSRGRRE
jgi:hypothetical protein